MPAAGPAEEETARIIAAAWRVLERTGFQGLKVGSVVRAVPISTRAFYRHFEDKEALVVVLLAGELRAAGLRLSNLVGGIADPRTAVSEWIGIYVGMADQPQLAARARLFSSIRSAAERTSDDVLAAQEEFLAPLREVLEAGRRSGAFPTARPDADARAIYHLCAGALTDALNASDPAATSAAVEEIRAFVMRALGARTTDAPSTNA